MELKKIDSKQIFVFAVSIVVLILSILSFVNVKTDLTYEISTRIDLVKAGALSASYATIESLPIDFSDENNFVISDDTHVVYLEDKVVVFYKSGDSLYHFDVTYESEKVSILWPFDDREEVVKEVDLKFSQYDNSESFKVNILNNLESISIVYRGHVYNTLDVVEIDNISEHNSAVVPPTAPVIEEDSDGSITLTIDEIGIISVSDTITIDYRYAIEPYKITIPKDGLLLRKTTSENDIVYVELTKLVFSQVDSDKDLQENIDSYLIGALVGYPKVLTPSPY